MARTEKYKKKLKNIGIFLAISSLSLYIIMLFTFIAFLTTMLLLGLIIVAPLIVIGILKKDRMILIRRIKASCWTLGILILVLFPTFWLIPQQMYVRVNRQETLITPTIEPVDNLADEFLAETPTFGTMNFTQKAKSVSRFTILKINWKLDYETYGMAGHVATPAEVIARGEDDCQGQAVVLASLLLNPKINFTYVWVVETPWHWYVLVRDPAKGALSSGWEKNVEVYQENGEIMPLNRDGTGNSDAGGGMPEYRWEDVQLIFNDKETLFPTNFFGMVLIGWTATGFFVYELFPLFTSFEFLYIIIACFVLAFVMVGWTSYMTKRDGDRSERKKFRSWKILLPKLIILGSLIIGFFAQWFFTQNILWDYTIIIMFSELSIISVLASESKFWRVLRVE